MDIAEKRRHRKSYIKTTEFLARAGGTSLAQVIIAVCTCGTYYVRIDSGERFWSASRCYGRMPVIFEHPSEFGDLTVYVNAEYIRPASKEEQLRSKEAARKDGGRGVIDVGGVQCFVND